jgi:hypothetical protein
VVERGDKRGPRRFTKLSGEDVDRKIQANRQQQIERRKVSKLAQRALEVDDPATLPADR